MDPVVFGIIGVMFVVIVFSVVIWLISRSDWEYYPTSSGESREVKCSHCGRRYSFDTNDAYLDWDFTGYDEYVVECPHCGRNNFVRK